MMKNIAEMGEVQASVANRDAVANGGVAAILPLSMARMGVGKWTYGR